MCAMIILGVPLGKGPEVALIQSDLIVVTAEAPHSLWVGAVTK